MREFSPVRDSLDIYEEVLRAYEVCGFDSSAIRQWCIPEADAKSLVATTLKHRPKRILEVGTYVGVSTHLLAQVSDTQAVIVTVDPNLALGAEMGSMRSDLGDLDSAARSLDLARAVARQLRVEDRIHFIEGGFSTGETFSSSRGNAEAKVPIVGPVTCAQFGPFDLIFVDGLHFAAAVQSDLQLAASSLAPGGIILMHDCIGMWGTNVRAGIFRFLSANPEFRLVHPSFGELYRSIGAVFRASEHPELLKDLRNWTPPANAAIRSIVSAALQHLRPDSVHELRLGCVVEDPLLADSGCNSASVEILRRPDAGWGIDEALEQAAACFAATSNGRRLLVSFGLIDQLDRHDLGRLLDWIREQDVLALIGFTPPGEVGVAGLNSYSFPQICKIATEAGLCISSVSSLDVDPLGFAFTRMHVDGFVGTSLCANTALLGSDLRMNEARHNAPDYVIPVVGVTAEAFEQDNLLRVHYSQAFRSLFESEGLFGTEIVRLTSQYQEQARTSDDLRTQVRSQIVRADDLARQIGEYENALRERERVEADVRRQLAEQFARGEDLTRQVTEYREAFGTAQVVESDLRRQLAELFARGEDLTRQAAELRAACIPRDLPPA
jgi:predicted O-methyltransferase YrrM/chaperonin cofactor prefoldin